MSPHDIITPFSVPYYTSGFDPDLWVQSEHFLVAPLAEVHPESLSPDARVHPQPQVDGRRRAGKDVVGLVPNQGPAAFLLIIVSVVQGDTSGR